MQTPSRARAAAVVSGALGALVLTASPASASTGAAVEEPMSVGQAVLVFAGIPLAFVALVWLLVSAPSWTRGGRANAVTGWTGDPLVLDGHDSSGATGVAPAHEASALEPGTTDTTGGTSARW